VEGGVWEGGGINTTATEEGGELTVIQFVVALILASEVRTDGLQTIPVGFQQDTNPNSRKAVPILVFETPSWTLSNSSDSY